jgi:hypothetical protein
VSGTVSEGGAVIRPELDVIEAQVSARDV